MINRCKVLSDALLSAMNNCDKHLASLIAYKLQDQCSKIISSMRFKYPLHSSVQQLCVCMGLVQAVLYKPIYDYMGRRVHN